MKQEAPRFNAADVSGRTRSLAQELHGELTASKIPQVQALAPMAASARAKDDEAALTLAFVGQYDAGKSTIIKALTGRDDIAIDAGVCTTEPTPYPWHNLLLIDTPGVQAGHDDHDALTARAILDADLVVFVITAELFSDVSARYFRRLMLDDDKTGEGKAGESLLVVNKMTLDNGTEEVKRPYVDAVCHPLSSLDFGTVFMDAKCYLDSLDCEDETDRRELRDASRFDVFIDTLNRFVRERCDLGRITQPLFQLRSVAQQAAALAGTDKPAERAAIELLGRLEACVSESKTQMTARLRGALGGAVSQIEKAGDELAGAIREGASLEEVKAIEEASIEKANAVRANLADEARKIIEAEVAELQEKLATIARSSLGRRVMEDISSGAIHIRGEFNADFGRAAPPPNDFGETPGIDLSGLRKGADIAQRIGNLLGNWAAGPKAAGGGFFSASQAAGGQAHRFVYDAGKFFGKNFKPFEAVKYAKWIGNLGRVLGAAGAIISVVVEIRDEKKDQKRQLELAGHRSDARTQFREMARALSDAFWSQFHEYERVQYDAELDALGGMRNQLVSGQTGRSEESDRFAALAERADELIRALG